LQELAGCLATSEQTRERRPAGLELCVEVDRGVLGDPEGIAQADESSHRATKAKPLGEALLDRLEEAVLLLLDALEASLGLRGVGADLDLQPRQEIRHQG
jgi:hypothetical protein